MTNETATPGNSQWCHACAHLAGRPVDRRVCGHPAPVHADDTDHECGHRFEFSVRSSLHTSGPGEHRDADWWGTPDGPVTVRAHNLRDALRAAADLPLTAWFPDEPAYDPDAAALIERSSLGTPEAKALRATVSDEHAARIVARSKELADDTDAGDEGVRLTAAAVEALSNAAIAVNGYFPDDLVDVVKRILRVRFAEVTASNGRYEVENQKFLRDLMDEQERREATEARLGEGVVESLAEHRREWADYIDRWTGSVGAHPPTVEAIVAALRSGRVPFGHTAGTVATVEWVEAP